MIESIIRVTCVYMAVAVARIAAAGIEVKVQGDGADGFVLTAYASRRRVKAALREECFIQDLASDCIVRVHDADCTDLANCGGCYKAAATVHLFCGVCGEDDCDDVMAHIDDEDLMHVIMGSAIGHPEGFCRECGNCATVYEMDTNGYLCGECGGLIRHPAHWLGIA